MFMFGLSSKDGEELGEFRSSLRKAFRRFHEEPAHAWFEFLFNLVIITILVGAGVALILLLTFFLLPAFALGILIYWEMGFLCFGAAIIAALGITGEKPWKNINLHPMSKK